MKLRCYRHGAGNTVEAECVDCWRERYETAAHQADAFAHGVDLTLRALTGKPDMIASVKSLPPGETVDVLAGRVRHRADALEATLWDLHYQLFVLEEDAYNRCERETWKALSRLRALVDWELMYVERCRKEAAGGSGESDTDDS